MADLIDYGVTNADQSYSFVRGEYEVEKSLILISECE